jgi:hypothetical protein
MTQASVTDEMIDKAMTAYDEFIGADDEADYEAMRAALEAAISTQPKAVSMEKLEAFQAEFESSPVRKGQSSYDLGYFDGYRDALGAAIDLTAIIGEGD